MRSNESVLMDELPKRVLAEDDEGGAWRLVFIGDDEPYPFMEYTQHGKPQGRVSLETFFMVGPLNELHAAAREAFFKMIDDTMTGIKPCQAGAGGKWSVMDCRAWREQSIRPHLACLLDRSIGIVSPKGSAG